MVFLLAGGVLPPRAAAASMLGYALLGLAGLPVLAAPLRRSNLYFQTYLRIYTGLCGRSLDGVHGHPQAGTQFPIYLAACTAGIIVLYLIGLPYLYIILRFYLGKL